MDFPGRTKLSRLVLVALAVLYVAWAARFIASSSVQIDQGRYFCLFDDAMISLRYAWNLAHGSGLVWNAGDRVEGTTSFLSAIYMSLGAIFLDKSQAALFVQISGVALVLGVALLALCVSRLLDVTGHFGLITAAAALAYYPLSYWSLMGMETGLLSALSVAAVLVAMRLGPDPQGSQLLGVLLGLMFVTRPDAAVPAALILGFRLAWILLCHRRLGALRPWLGELAAFASVLGGLTLFRLVYYGSPVPNTYLLKIEGWPLAARLKNGWLFVLPFLQSSRYLLLLAICSVAFHRDTRRLLLLCFAGCIVGCQVWVGGDAWPYWRMLTPGVVALLVLVVDGAAYLVRRVVRPELGWLIAAGTLALSLGAVWTADQPFADELRLKTRPYKAGLNDAMVGTGVKLACYVDPQASIAVAAAGALPYYSGLRGIDVLGKSDRHVARLPPDLAFSADGRTVTPGHNKYDLHYSIEQLRPDVIYDAVEWGHDDMHDFVRRRYILWGSWWFRRDSPYVHWDRLPPLLDHRLQ